MRTNIRREKGLALLLRQKLCMTGRMLARGRLGRGAWPKNFKAGEQALRFSDLVKSYFRPCSKVSSPPHFDLQVWCCCTDHKRATVALIMKELPYKTFIKADETNLAPNYPPLPLAARMAMRLYNPC